MKIVSVSLGRFLTHQGTEAALDPEGLTTIVGPNGAGKTALGLEAVCWALWGKTTRGTTPDGEVEVEFEVRGPGRAGPGVYVARRVRAGGKARELTLTSEANADMTGQTAAETQAKILALVGGWDRFCATRVFSKRLRNRFGSATDKERKALLEGVLGLERYERAAKLARAELGMRKEGLGSARAGLQTAQALVQAAERAVASVPLAADGEPLDARRARRLAAVAALSLAEDEDRQATAAERGAFERREVISRAAAQARATARLAGDDQRRARARLMAVQEERAQALERGTCPTCFTRAENMDRALLEGHWNNLRDAATAELTAVNERVDAAGRELADLAGDLEVAEAARTAAVARSGPAHAAVAIARAELGGIEIKLAAEERRADELRRALAAADRAAARVAEAEGAERDAEVACLEAEAAVEALGSKGARVSRMERALARLTAAANRVLAPMPIEGAGALRVSVTARREGAGGREVDEVGVLVEGAGGGEYDGTSDGEQARVDAALMLGMASLADGEGYVAFDEVFDSLDAPGLEAVVELLRELATRRQVVVISHNPRFLDLLPGGAGLRVARGEGGRAEVARA